MINFTKIQSQIIEYDSQREKLIKKSRDVLKLSKQVIYSVHRGDNASVLVKQMEAEKKALDIISKHNTKLLYEGSYKIAVQEYVEAMLYYHFVKSGDLVNLKVQPEHFVLGLADLPGELVRKAVFLAGKGEVDKVNKIKDTVDLIYGEMLKFDFRDNEIRRKVDGIKYDLRKLEDLVLDLKLKGR
jgi:predicted translin family RNA/ssDNA-binding protein